MKRWLLILGSAALSLVLLIALTAQMRRASAAEHSLRETTLLALSEAAEETQSLALAMDKLRIAGSGQQGAFLRQVVQHADRARHALSSLPGDPDHVAPALTWLSRLTNLAEEDLIALENGESVSSEDVTARQSETHLLHTELELARQELLLGGNLASALPGTALTAPPTANDLVNYKGLPATNIGSGEALRIAREFVGDNRVRSVVHAPDTSGALPAYGVTVQTADIQLNLEVTSRGGKVLLMVPETAGFREEKTVDDCRAAAAAFLDARGFAAMEPTYYQIYGGMCVMTFVHVQEEVLIWADRVTVQVRMDTAEVVGIEARSYWKNHTPRHLPIPLLTESEARAFLSSAVTTESTRLCLLPIEGRERLCWQFTVLSGDDRYVAYIDAITGTELLLEKVMQLESGSMAA